MNKESGRKIIAERVEEFEKSKAILTKKGHGETNIRSNYIDIMFQALGWNMKSHYEVVREYSQRDRANDGGTKKVDYAFKINGKIKFFIEAKEASVDLEKDKSAIYQAKRYAYSSNGKAPIVILTDFEEFRVFNVIKAPLMDNADRELLKSHTMRYTDYIEKWDLLWDIFSREAVGNGSLDKLSGKIDKNTKTMDVDFLEQITNWRELLAKNIAIRNENLNVDEINEAVQRILDRLVFIRNLEDREIEPENTLLDKARKSENIYKSIIPIFNSLNTTYNGLLFKKHFSEDIDVDDKTIHDIIRQMNYPVSPFQFDVIEPEILGRIYEKFLGSKIRLTDSHRAKIEEKIEVRKAGGVYYTPEYIVEYIVQNTVGKKIEGLTPNDIKNIKIVDPACGSGSFLIGAYSYLLDYHQKLYTENQKDKTYQADWYKTKDGEIKVRLDKRADILKNNIFGVDIDKEATEVAIMSLYLKMLDDGFDKGERDLFFIRGSVLPDMVENIKCGNSLIESNYFNCKLEFDIQEMKEVKPFNWEEAFPSIMSNGGFDCVIGNPPYVILSSDIFNEESIKYLKSSYDVAQYKTDLYHLFIQRGIQKLKLNGILGFITPNTWFTLQFTSSLRKYVLNNTKIQELVVLNHRVFEDADVHTGLMFLIKNDTKAPNIISFKNLPNDFSYELMNSAEIIEINQDDWLMDDNCIFETRQVGQKGEIVKKIISKYPQLNKVARASLGIQAYNSLKHSKEQISNRVFHSNTKLSDEYLPELAGNDVSRFFIERKKGQWIKYGDWLHDYRTMDWLTGPRILIREIPGKNEYKILASYVEETFCNYKTILNVNPSNETKFSMKYLLGIINSRLLSFIYPFVSNKIVAESFPRLSVKDVKNLPIRDIDFSNEEDRKLHDQMVLLVDQMLKTQNDFINVISDADKNIYKQKLSLLNKKIDQLVYSLYNLTDEEIKIVESN